MSNSRKAFSEPALKTIEGGAHKQYNSFHTRVPRKIVLNISDHEIKKLIALSGKTFSTPEAILEDLIGDLTNSEYSTGYTELALKWFNEGHTPEYPEKNFVTFVHNNNYATPVVKLVEAYVSAVECIKEYSEMVYLDQEAREDKAYYEQEALESKKQLKVYYEQYKLFNTHAEPFENSIKLLKNWIAETKKIKVRQK